MKHFIDENGEFWGFTQDQILEGLSDNMRELTDIEFDNIQNPIKYFSEEEKLAYKRSQYPKLTRYQFMRGLLENGYKSSDIEAKIMLIEDEYTRELTMIGFKDATNFVRTDESVIAMQSILNLNDEKVDAMWEYALTL